MSTMRLEKQENVYLLTLTNGERANTMTDAVLDEYHAALDEVEATQGNTALVITSEDPKFFSNGIDLEYIKSKGMEYLFSHFGARLDQLLMRVALINFPTIACVNGHAYGGGALLSSACDFRTMRADRGFFCFPEVDIKLAFTPAMLASVNLLRNEQLRFEMALTGRPVGGEEAAKKGIVDAALPAEELLPKTLAMAAQLATKDRRTYAQIKRDMRQHLLPLVDESRR